MRSKLRVFFACLLATLFVVSFAGACAPEGENSGSLTITPATVEQLTVGSTQKLTVKDADGKTVAADQLTWTSGNNAVATVNDKGTVTAVAVGTTDITAEHTDGRTAKATVTVIERPVITVKQGDTAVTAVSVERDQTIELTATVSNGADVTWSTSSDEIQITPDGNSVTVKGVQKTTEPASLYVSSKGAAGVEIKVTVTFENASADYYDIEFSGESDMLAAEKANKWWYWNSQQLDWAQATVKVARADYDGGTATFVYEGNSGQFYGMQLFYNNPTEVEVGKMYHLSFTMDSTSSGQVTANNIVINVQTGSHTYDVYYTQAANQASFRMMMGVENSSNIQAATVKISNLHWEAVAKLETPATPTALVIDGKNVTITDSNDVANLTGYKLIFKQNGATKAAWVISGKTGTIDDAAIKDGVYDVHVQALGNAQKNYGNSAESGKLATYTVANGGVNYSPKNTGAGGAKAEPGRWTYREEWAGNFTNIKVENDVLTFTYPGGGNWDSYQVYFKNPANEEGKSYKVTMKFTVSNPAETIPAGHKILISGVEHTLVQGENTFEATITEGNEYSIQILFDVWHAEESNPSYGGAGRLGSCDFSITELTFVEDAGEPVVSGTIVAGEEANATDHWVYWSDKGYEPAYSWVEVTEAKYTTNDDGSFNVSAKFESQNEKVCDWGFQLFYNDPSFEAGKSYTLTLTAKVSNDCEIGFNGAERKAFTANVEQQISVTFTLGSGMSLFDMQVKPNAKTAYELTLTNIKWVAAD